MRMPPASGIVTRHILAPFRSTVAWRSAALFADGRQCMLFLMLFMPLLDNSMAMLSRGAVHVALWFSRGFLGYKRI